MFLGDPEIKITPPRGANLGAAGALGGDYRGGYFSRVTVFWGQFCSRLEVQRFSILESLESVSYTHLTLPTTVIV